MNQRYGIKEGIVIRRLELPSGDVVVTLFGEEGKWRGVARKGKLPGGNLGRLSLFHNVVVQYYQKRDEDLTLITQVALNGALPKLSKPEIYPYAHLLAELTDKLSVDVHVGEASYGYLAGGLRGLSHHCDPEAVALVICWKLLQQAGLSPRMRACVHCGSPELGSRFDVAAGGITCRRCHNGLPLSPQVLAELTHLLQETVREALSEPIGERRGHWAVLMRYVTYHVGTVNSFGNLPQPTLEESVKG